MIINLLEEGLEVIVLHLQVEGNSPLLVDNNQDTVQVEVGADQLQGTVQAVDTVQVVDTVQAVDTDLELGIGLVEEVGIDQGEGVVLVVLDTVLGNVHLTCLMTLKMYLQKYLYEKQNQSRN